jgi:hypothetical protein
MVFKMAFRCGAYSGYAEEIQRLERNNLNLITTNICKLLKRIFVDGSYGVYQPMVRGQLPRRRLIYGGLQMLVIIKLNTCYHNWKN